MKNDLIKKPNVETEFTHEQIIEMFKCKRDPIYFMKTYMKVINPKLGAVPFLMFPYQERAVDAFLNNRWCSVLAGRQLGKTTVIAAYLLWFACFNFDKYVLVASKDNDAAIDVMDRIRYGYEELPMWLKPGCLYFNRHEIVFDNKSAIKSSATTENTGRGRSIALLMLDELAFVKREIQQAMWTSLAPTLSTGGQCIISSTPNGDQDLFAEIWRESNTNGESKVGANGFFPVRVEWDEHPDRDEQYRRDMIAKIGSDMWEQEYECKFLSSDPMLIKSSIANALVARPVLTEDNGFKFYYNIDPTRMYFVSLDVAEGLGKDYSVIEVFDKATMSQVAEFRSNTTSEAGLYDKLKWILKKILATIDRSGNRPEIYWSFENNSCGKVISTLYYNDDDFPEGADLVTVGAKLGMNTNVSTKKEACLAFKKLIEGYGLMSVSSQDLINEIKNFHQRGSSYEAKKGSTDDSISACLIAVRILIYLATFDEDAFNALYRGQGAEQLTNYEEEELPPMPVLL